MANPNDPLEQRNPESANIRSIDKQQGRFMGWHQKTDVLEAINWENCWLNQWDGVPVAGNFGGIETDYQMLKCSDVNRLIGGPFDPSTFGYISNSRLIELLKEALKGTNHVIETCGSLYNRERVFFSLKLDNAFTEFRVAGRNYQTYFNVLNALTPKRGCSLTGSSSNECVVCSNSFRRALIVDGKEFHFRLRKSKNVIDRLENFGELIEAHIGVQAEFKHTLELAEKVPVNANQARELFGGVILADYRGEEPISTKAENTLNELVRLHKEGKGNEGRTLVDAFQAMTDLGTHGMEKSKKSRLAQFASSEYGTGNEYKNAFYDAMRAKDGIARLASVGRKAFDLNREALKNKLVLAAN